MTKHRPGIWAQCIDGPLQGERITIALVWDAARHQFVTAIPAFDLFEAKRGAGMIGDDPLPFRDGDAPRHPNGNYHGTLPHIYRYELVEHFTMAGEALHALPRNHWTLSPPRFPLLQLRHVPEPPLAESGTSDVDS